MEDIPVTRRKIIEFGITFFVILSMLLPLFVGWKNDWVWPSWLIWPVAVGVLILSVSAFTGMLMAPVYRLWMRFALVLGTIMTAVIVTVVFYLLITPIGLIRRLSGSKSAYQKKMDKSASTYWVARNYKADGTGMEKMY